MWGRCSAGLPQPTVQNIAFDGQALHERFLKLQQEAARPSPDAASITSFHSDLAEFVGRVEDLLGLSRVLPEPKSSSDVFWLMFFACACSCYGALQKDEGKSHCAACSFA
eukprot:91079-Amphidinium_carterae.1